jgi:hypothetical protein
MSSNLVSNVAITGNLMYSGTLSLPYITSNTTGFINNYASSFNTRLPIFYGAVGLGVTPTTQELDLSTDLARKLTTSTWTTGSDIRIKTNIETANLVRCAEIVDTVDLKYFEWKTPTEDHHSLGWIAQEVQHVFPNSVVPDSEGTLMLNSDQLIKVLYGALKQTQLEFFPN